MCNQWVNDLICPDCHCKVYRRQEGLFCNKCGRVFEERDGILNLLPAAKNVYAAIEERDLEIFDNTKTINEQLSQFRGARKLIADWASTTIQDINYRMIRSYLGQDMKVLEIGCGRGYFTTLISRIAHVAAFDISRSSLEYAKGLGNCDTKAFYFQGNVYSIPFEANTFDIVVAAEVLEHLPGLRNAITEINRVLKSEGLVVASVPNTLMFLYPLVLVLMCIRKGGYKRLVGLMKRQVDDSPMLYSRPFLPKQFRTLFEDNGFKVIQHRTSMWYFWRFPYDSIILWGDKHCPRITKWVVDLIIKTTDQLLDKELPVIKWFGTRQHILAKRGFALKVALAPKVEEGVSSTHRLLLEANLWLG